MKSLFLCALLALSSLSLSLPVRAESESLILAQGEETLDTELDASDPDVSEPESLVETSESELEVAKQPALQGLQTWVENFDRAANDQRLKPLLKNYSRSFRHADGFDRKQLGRTLKSFWQGYRQLSYKTTIDSWEMKSPNHFMTQTTTVITGEKEVSGGRVQTLMATLTTEQEIVDNKITQQTTLKERSITQSGANPPKVQINLPDQVAVGEDYFLDVIVDEPIGDRILLGAAIEETVTANPEIPPTIQLESLSTGGLFKIGTAPENPTDEWISAILVQEGGTLMVSQRLSVVEANPSSNP